MTIIQNGVWFVEAHFSDDGDGRYSKHAGM